MPQCERHEEGKGGPVAFFEDVYVELPFCAAALTIGIDVLLRKQQSCRGCPMINPSASIARHHRCFATPDAEGPCWYSEMAHGEDQGEEAQPPPRWCCGHRGVTNEDTGQRHYPAEALEGGAGSGGERGSGREPVRETGDDWGAGDSAVATNLNSSGSKRSRVRGAGV